MGAEHSSARNRRTRDSTYTRTAAPPQPDFSAEYHEQRLNELVKEQMKIYESIKRATESPSSAPSGQGSGTSQRPQSSGSTNYGQPTASTGTPSNPLRSYQFAQSPSSAPVGGPGTSQRPQSSGSIIYGQATTSSGTSSNLFQSSQAAQSLERPRAPYNFSQSELQEAVLQTKSNFASTSQQNQPAAACNFVFVERSSEAARFQPSAPPAPKERSASRTRSRDDDAPKCPTCKQTYGVTIFQCPNGHSSCNECKTFGRLCGICHRKITDMRNITLETVISERKVNCTNSEQGCRLYLKLADLETHIKECPFREMNCPLNQIFGHCNWKGKIGQIKEHFDNIHQIHRQANVDTEMYLFNIHSNHNIANLIVIGTYNFLFHLKVSQDEQTVYIAVQLIGTAFSANKWSYEVHIYSKREPRRKYQHVDTCHSSNTNINELFKEGKCAKIPLTYLATFINEDRLTYKFYIKQIKADKTFPKNQRGRRRGGHSKTEDNNINT